MIQYLDEFLTILSFQGGFNTNLVLFATILLGMAAGSTGTFLVLRKRTMMSDALAHSTLPGLAIGFLVCIAFGVQEKNFLLLLASACISGVCGVFCIHSLSQYTRLSEDSAIGIVLSVFFGLGIVLLSYIQNIGNSGGIHHFIFGQTASMTRSDLTLTVLIAAIALLLSTLLFKEFTILCFDKESASVQGWPTDILDLVLLLLVTLVTIVGLQAVGMILIIALLSIPPTAARFWSERLSVVFFISTLIGASSGYLGAALSAVVPGVPTGAIIVLVAGFLFLVSFVCAPRHGYLAEKLRALALQERIVQEHILRSAYEHLEAKQQASDASLPYTVLPGYLTLHPLVRWLLRRSLKKRQFVLAERDAFRFTDKGYEEARRLTRNHRLWEQYLYHHGSISLSHIDYSADLVEHVLSEEMIQRLEQDLQSRGTFLGAVPESIHALAEDVPHE